MRELEVVARVVAGGVRRERARRAVLEALVDGEDHHLARAGERAVVEHAGQVGLRARVVAAVPGQDLAERGRSFLGFSCGGGWFRPEQTAWPPNSRRSADRTRPEKADSCRERKRA